MARGDKSKSISAEKESTRKKQRKLQASGMSKRSAENRAWDETNQARSKRQTGTAGGRSKVSKRTTAPARNIGSTRKAKTVGKTRR
jgi:hypothetical protein